MYLSLSIQLFWQTLVTREEGRTEDLEHAASRFCGKCGMPDTG